MKKTAVIVYGAVSYIVFACSLLYFIGFLTNVGVPKSVDVGSLGSAQTPLLHALLVDLGLIGLFGLQHSVMARKGFKQRWTRLVPPPIERSTYVLFASAMLILMMWQWRPMPVTIWHIDHLAGRLVIYGMFGFGVMLVLLSTFLIDHFELFGLKQAYAYFTGRRPAAPEYKTPFLYKLMRHPLILGFIIQFWSTPHMTVGHFVLAFGMTTYCIIGVALEERDLVRSFGESYRSYQRSTPMLLPIRSVRSMRRRPQSADRYA